MEKEVIVSTDIADKIWNDLLGSGLCNFIYAGRRDIALDARFKGPESKYYLGIFVKTVCYKQARDLTQEELEGFGMKDFDAYLKYVRKAHPEFRKDSEVTVVSFLPILGG